MLTMDVALLLLLVFESKVQVLAVSIRQNAPPVCFQRIMQIPPIGIKVRPWQKAGC